MLTQVNIPTSRLQLCSDWIPEHLPSNVANPLGALEDELHRVCRRTRENRNELEKRLLIDQYNREVALGAGFGGRPILGAGGIHSAALRRMDFAATNPHSMATAPQPQTGILALEGEIDLHRSPQVKEGLEPLIAQKLPRILLDFSAVTYIDSSGLATMIETLQRIQAYGGKLAMFGLRDSVRPVFS